MTMKRHTILLWLLINFGDIPSGEARIGRWEMVTTLSGQFTSFNCCEPRFDHIFC